MDDKHFLVLLNDTQVRLTASVFLLVPISLTIAFQLTRSPSVSYPFRFGRSSSLVTTPNGRSISSSRSFKARY
jgi:hypothetical protein